MSDSNPTGEIRNLLKLDGVYVCRDSEKTRANFPKADPVAVQMPTVEEAKDGVVMREVIEGETVDIQIVEEPVEVEAPAVMPYEISEDPRVSAAAEAAADDLFDN